MPESSANFSSPEVSLHQLEIIEFEDFCSTKKPTLDVQLDDRFWISIKIYLSLTSFQFNGPCFREVL